ncbi:MAG: PAS domain S-box protein [Myxococcota bacterium]
MNLSHELIFVHPLVTPRQPSCFLDVSDFACDRLGYSRDELLRMGPLDLLGDAEPSALDADAEELQAGRPAMFVKTLYGKSGEAVRCEIQACLVQLDGEQLVVSVARDVSARVRAEAELARSEARYRKIVELANEGIWQIDADGNTTFVNDRLAAMLGHEREAMVGRPLFDFMDADAQRDAQRYLERRKQGVFEQHEFRFRHRDGRDVWAWLSTSPWTEGGEFIGALAMVTDVTERKRDRERLERSEKRYHELLESLPDAVFILDRQWRHVLVNEAATSFTGNRRDVLLGARLTDLFPQVEETGFFACFKRVMRGGPPEVLVDAFPFADGRTGWYEIRTFPVPEGVLCISRDMTLRVEAENALRASEEKLSGILDNMQDVLWSMTWPDLELLYITPSVERVFGHPAEAFAENQGLWIETTHPDDRPGIEVALQTLREHGSVERKYRAVRPDGREVWVLDKSQLIYDGQGRPVRIDGVSTDISEVQSLRGLLPICSHCKKIRDDDGYWHDVEQYIGANADVRFSHGLCQECLRGLYPEFADDDV